MRRLRSAFEILATATVLLTPAAIAAQSEAVTGTITAKGLRTNADIVVSLHAPGLKVSPPSKPIEMDQKGMLFIPHVLPVVKGTTVRFFNSDPVPHNVFSPEGKYNLGTWPTGQVRDYKFEKPGVYTQLCRVHPEMEAFVVVLDTPHFAVTDNAGRFEIADVPPGKYTLLAWSAKLRGTKQPITIDAGKSVTVNVTLGR